jgi:GMP reductase
MNNLTIPEYVGNPREYYVKDINYQDIILRNTKSIVQSRAECDISTYWGIKKYSSPVCCSNMKSLLTKDICKIFDNRKWFYVYHRIDGVKDVYDFVLKANEENWYSVSISVGLDQQWVDLLSLLKSENLRVDSITVDVAHSFNDNVKPIINSCRNNYPEAFLIVGNGSTREWVEFMEDLEVDCIKMGIGVSKACRTRQYTGFGSSTVSSLLECFEASKNVKIMTDGGLTVDSNGEIWVGDINKSLVLGSDYVMSGSAFSKCVDSPATFNGYYGNASESAKGHRRNIEGTNLKVVTNGLTISQMCDLIEDSIRSGISYAGGKDLSAFKRVQYSIIEK